MASPTAEEFAAWRDNPVTRWVMAAARKAADGNKSAWDDLAWESGIADQAKLIELRTRADAYMALIETDYDAWVEINEGVQGG